MEKRISYSQFQSVKRVAQACDPLIVKKSKLKEKIEKLAAEYKDYDMQIASLEAGIKNVVGFRVEELVKKVIEPGVDQNGQPKKTTKYLPTDIVSYDEEKKQFVISVPDENEIIDAEFEDTTTEGPAGDSPINPTEETETPNIEVPESASIFD